MPMTSIVSRLPDELEVDGDLDLIAESLPAGREWHLPVHVPIAAIDDAAELDRRAGRTEGILDRRRVRARRRDGAHDALDLELAVHRDAAVLGELDAGGAEDELRVVRRVEEILTVDDVLAHLGRVCDRDGCNPSTTLERDAGLAGLETGLDVAEGRTEARDRHVLHGELKRRVMGVGREIAGELLDGCGHWVSFSLLYRDDPEQARRVTPRDPCHVRSTARAAVVSPIAGSVRGRRPGERAAATTPRADKLLATHSAGRKPSTNTCGDP